MKVFSYREHRPFDGEVIENLEFFGICVMQRTKNFHSCDVAVDCFVRIEFSLTFEIGHKCIFSLKVIFKFSTNQISRKSQIRLVEDFNIGNDGRVIAMNPEQIVPLMENWLGTFDVRLF